ncbi:ABC transporter substrate-binding protein [Ancylobacter sp. A5.8]|uniref:CmpA/NrtA family ABC transporter substrate-binding protein n=1 Tax=Ancylobacter gelatini TaxID=2919920 RepID=UPI001F4D9095|nr:CmpA/NrtA family ABC transporter substrate-binding protein [Ancylobacter gelatini]MCJ8143421.1 ABC transporter substrate-binding protein [Ancylobacter gelatini]
MRIRAGFIPLVDAAILVAAADHGFAAAEGVELELVREVSWSNVRDKLTLGHFEAAHILAPLAIAISLGLDHARVPLASLVAMNQNGNSFLLGNETFRALEEQAQGGDLADPFISGSALKRLLAVRAARGEDQLVFGMTFPFSTHNYLLRYWMAVAGIDPDRDVRLIVLPPPYMVDALSNGHVHGFCVGAPWPSVAVEAGIGRILHFGSEIVATCPEKVLAMRAGFVTENREATLALTRALIRATAWCATPENRVELAHLLAAPERLNLDADLILRSLDGRLRIDAQGMVREDPRYLVLESAAARPDARQAFWLYAQMVRWGQASLDDAARMAVEACYATEIYDTALAGLAGAGRRDDGIGAFAGPAFDPGDLTAYLAKISV